MKKNRVHRVVISRAYSPCKMGKGGKDGSRMHTKDDLRGTYIKTRRFMNWFRTSTDIVTPALYVARAASAPVLTFKTISRDVSRPSRRKAKFTRDVYEIAPREKKYVLQPTMMTTTTTTTAVARAGLPPYPRMRGSPRKNFDSFIPLLRCRNAEDFIIADTDGGGRRCEGRWRGSVERKALSRRDTCGYANIRGRGIREEWDMHLGECWYPALHGLQVAHRDPRSNSLHPSSLVFHEIGRNRSRIRGAGWAKIKRVKATEENLRIVGS